MGGKGGKYLFFEMRTVCETMPRQRRTCLTDEVIEGTLDAYPILPCHLPTHEQKLITTITRISHLVYLIALQGLQ